MLKNVKCVLSERKKRTICNQKYVFPSGTLALMRNMCYVKFTNVTK